VPKKVEIAWKLFSWYCGSYVVDGKLMVPAPHRVFFQFLFLVGGILRNRFDPEKDQHLFTFVDRCDGYEFYWVT
jgi:hypothetical protein